MRNQSMKEALYDLYSNIPKEFYDYVEAHNSKGEKLITNPYFITPSEKYANSEKRIMIVGKETYGWYSEGESNPKHHDLFSPNNSARELMESYDSFVNKKKGDSNYPFWQYGRWLQGIAGSAGYEVIYNNLAKIGYIYGEKGHDEQAARLLIPVFREELKICQPSMVVCFTGPYYDNLLKETLGEGCIREELASGKLLKITFQEGPFKDIVFYRTYHPGYLNRYREKEEWVKDVDNTLEHIF